MNIQMLITAIAVSLSMARKVSRQSKLKPYLGLDESFHMLGALFGGQIAVSSNINYAHILGNRECPDKGQTGRFNIVASQLPVHITNSTCPGYFVIGYDVNRDPKTIVEVRCACTRCMKNSAKCVAVNYYRKVKRRCKNPEYDYCEVIERVQVGCTCTRKSPGTNDQPVSIKG